MAMTRAQKIRAEKQEALRELLSKQKLVEHVIDLAKKMDEPDADYQRLKAAAEVRLKLINKYLPDMKLTEGTLELDGGLEVRVINYASK